MPTLILCYAAPDEPLAHRLGDFLQANLPLEVSYGEGVVRADFDLVDAAERALSAETSLILLSPDSGPKVWNRARWEPVFFTMPEEFGTRAGFALLRECRFPELIRRSRPFFDLSGNFLAGARQIKRWLMRPGSPFTQEPIVPEPLRALREEIGDRPGTVVGLDRASALEFASACGPDFHAVWRIDCRNRTPAGVIGHIGPTLGVPLPGTVEENRDSLARYFETHRGLAVFENSRPQDHELVAFGGLMSAVFAVVPGLTPEPASLDRLLAAFCSSPRDESRCAELMGDAALAVKELPDSEFVPRLRLGWAMVSALKAAARFAEAVEVLGFMEHAARTRGDAPALARIQWEQSWLCDSDGKTGAARILPTASAEVAQLTLNFTDR